MKHVFPQNGGGTCADAPTGRLDFGRAGPSDGLLSGSVRTGFSNGRTIESDDHQPEAPLQVVV